MYKLAVIGNPIEHSLSPKVFSLFAREFNLPISYVKIVAKNTQEFNQLTKDFLNSNGIAISITSPFKHEAYLLTKNHTPRASFCKTSNFVYLDKTQNIIADTTDGIGIVNDFENNNNIHLYNKKILILGSGFVLDSILLDLIIKNPASIHVLARNHQRISVLQNKFGIDTHDISNNYDIIINTTPNTPENQLFDKIMRIDDDTFCYDMAYSQRITRFHQAMLKQNSNIKTQNGLGMLVEQAQVAFCRMFSHKPNTKNTLLNLEQGIY